MLRLTNRVFPGVDDLAHLMSDEEMSDDGFATDESSLSHASDSVDVSDDSECSSSDSDQTL